MNVQRKLDTLNIAHAYFSCRPYEPTKPQQFTEWNGVADVVYKEWEVYFSPKMRAHGKFNSDLKRFIDLNLRIHDTPREKNFLIGSGKSLKANKTTFDRWSNATADISPLTFNVQEV